MKNIKFLWLIIIAIFVASCSSTPEPEICYFPDDSGEEAPCWVETEHLGNDPAFQAVGSAKMGNNRQMSENRAKLGAQVKLAERISTQISGLVEDYANEISTAEGEIIDTGSYSQTARAVVNQRINGAYIMKKVISPEGDMYILMGMDPASVADILQQNVELAMQEEKILRENMKLEEAQNRLDAALVK